MPRVMEHVAWERYASPSLIIMFLIKVVVARFNVCYWTIKGLDESGMIEDDIVLNAMNLYKQKCLYFILFYFKYCWFLLKPYPYFAAIFAGKWKVGEFNILTQNVLFKDQRIGVAPNGVVVANNQTPYKMQPPRAKDEHEGEEAETMCQGQGNN